MGNEYNRHPGLCLNIFEKPQVLELDRHVQSGRRFVGDDYFGNTCYCDGAQHPLFHPTTHLVGIIV